MGAGVDPAAFLLQSRVIIVTGKGGTGKTTISGILANLAARAGLRALVVQVGERSGADSEPTAGEAPAPSQLARLFGHEKAVGWEPTLLLSLPNGGKVEARDLRPDVALVEYLHLHGMRRLSRRLVASGALDVVATAIPGMPDLLVLGKLKQMERAAAAGQPGAPDLIILDAPAAGHAVRFLQSPRGLLEAATAGPVHAQAEDVVEMLSDPSRCQVMIVTLPEETPVSETIETAYLIEDSVGVRLAPVIVNARLPQLPLPDQLDPQALGALAVQSGLELDEEELASLCAAGRLRARRQAAQAEQVARLAKVLPLPQLELPFCFSAALGPGELAALTDALAQGISGLPLVAT
ncbi:MAG: hypothetical protein ACP5VR_02200 [Acidimicrobiales bacterium]